LLTTSAAFGFQLPKSAPRIASPSAMNRATTANKLRPAQLHTPVSSHVHFPKRATSVHRPRIHRYGVSGKAHFHSIIRTHRTSVSGNSGTVSLAIDLGKPSTSSSNVSVTNAPSEMKFSKVSWQSLSRGMPSGVALLSATRGAPEYPVLTFTFSIPENASGITPILKTSSTTQLGNIYFPPSAKTIKGKSQRIFDPNSYSTSPQMTIGKPRTFRSLRMVTVSVPLVSSNGNMATGLEKFTVGINFSTTSAPVIASSATHDPLFADLNSRMVANTWDLSSFAVPLRNATAQKPRISKPISSKSFNFASLQGNTDTLLGWIDTNAAYVRLAVTRDGLYRVNASDLNFAPSQNFTLASSGWNARNLRCFNHGVEIPIWIDTDASGNITGIEFYGQHLRGFPLPTVRNSFLLYDYQVQEVSNFQLSDSNVRLPEYYNVATDTNVYWLASSVGDSSPKRYAAKSLVPSSAPSIPSGKVLLHHEQDKNYYTGDAALDETQTQEMTEYVPGERFEWAELHGTLDDSAKSHFTDTFYVSQLPADTVGKVATIKFLFRGMSSDPNFPNGTPHEVAVQVNNVSAGLPQVFNDYTYDSLPWSIPLSQLVQGPNVVRVNALSGGAHIDQFYLDYYEINFENALAPSTDTSITKGQWLFSLSPTSKTFRLAVSDGSAHLYNITDNTRIVSSTGQFFDSTSSIQPQYAAATTSSLLQCDNIQPWNTGSASVLSWQILSPKDQADYIVITHPNFRQSAEMLATRRKSQGMRTIVVTTDEIFNAFDFGSNEPEAIRRYLNYAYNNYAGAPVALVTLLGNASWDPKFNLAGSFQKTFVPSYGNPVSDCYFSLAEDSTLDSQPLMMISRIPVSSETAAENYISKLNEYENAPPAPWDSHFLFIAGGDLGSQHAEFDNAINEFMAPPNGLSVPPSNIQDTIINRTDYSGGVDPTHVGEIQSLLLAGQSVMYFGGHGATFTSDVAFPDASVLQNKGLYPLLITLTCRTGDFAEYNQIGVNQSYVQATEAGSVQAYGTTGFGVQEYDDQLTLAWIALMRSFDSIHDTLKPQTMNMLEMLTAAKMSTSQFDYGGGISHNEALQNCMLGDAAVGFAKRPQPEFAVFSSEVHGFASANSQPQTSFSISDDSMTIRALIHNYGYAANRPVVIRITDAGPNGFPTIRSDTLAGLNDSAFVSAVFGLNTQSIGLHRITVIIDPDHNFTEESYRPDDSASIQVQVNGLSTTAFFPYEGERQLCDIGPNSVHFIVLPPSGSNPNDQVELELDTTEAFSNFLTDRKTPIGSSYYVTFDIPIPPSPVPSSSVYWWRTRVVRTSGDTTQWQYATFSTAPAPRSEFSYTSTEQLTSTIVNGLTLNAHGMLYLPLQDTMHLQAISHGINDVTLGGTFSPYTQVSLNGIPIWQDTAILSNGSIFDNGFVVLVWTPDGTQIDSADEFEMPWDSLGQQHYEDSMAVIFNAALSAIPPSRRVMVLTVGSVDFTNYFFPAVLTQMQTLGSALGMKPMAYDGSYALIGTKGSAPGTAKEAFAGEFATGAKAFDTIITAGTSGFAETPYTAVAKDYGALSWTGDPIVNGNDIIFTVLGSRRDGTGIDVVDTFKASNGTSFSLSNINPRTYDRLSVQMGFSRTANTSQSPALSGIALQYDPAPEFTFATDSVSCVPKIMNSGGTTIASYAATTLTCTAGDSVLVMLIRQNQGKTDTPIIHTFTQIAGHGIQSFNDTLQTQNELGNATITAVINPNEAQNEQLLFNNTINGSYAITRDTMSPSGEILFVDPTDQIPQHISADCGYVSSRSTIKIQMLSGNPLRDTSSGSITAYFLNESNASQVFTVSTANPHGYQVQFQSFPAGPLQAQLTIVPTTPFTAGTWLMKAYLLDASGNTDTVEQCFTVSDVNGIEEVMNYPNPFKDKTDFTFVLKSDAPADIKIVVYTIAGRKIRTLTPTLLHAGFNAVEWDGRDERGNEVANGTYLYRVVINGTNGDNVSDAVSQTAVRAR